VGKFMTAAAALSRLVEDEKALLADRIRALKLIEHPSLCMLRRLLHRPNRTDPPAAPPRLLAVAALKYAKEVAYRKAKAKLPKYARKPDGNLPNALGI
jgi:hypothetical protein